MKKFTRYSLPNPTTVKDPRTDGYTVVVHPCQDILLFLTDPVNDFKEAVAGDDWEVRAYSDYFYLDAVSTGPGKREYRFVQYYNMKPWTDVSSVYLGDIEITLNSKTASCKSFSLCVIARSTGKKQSRIVTAVNPVVNRVKLDMDEILEVVVSRDDPARSSEEVWCSLYDMGRSGTGNGSQWFERLRQETLLLPETSPLPRDSGSLYFTMARSVAALERNPGLPHDKNVPNAGQQPIQRQHHFWFRVRPEDKAAVLKANTGDPMANVVFNGTSGTCSNLQVLISTRGTRAEPEVPEYDKVRYEGNYRGLVGRYYSPTAGLLVNPGKVEGTVEILPQQNGVMVELAPPQMTWPYTDPKYRWKCEVEPVMASVTTVLPAGVDLGKGDVNKTQTKRVTCTELIDRSINQQAIQRFFIKPQCEVPADENMLYLGMVNFVCKEPSVIGKRTINCWLVRERSTTDEQDVLGAERYKELMPLPSLKRQAQPRHVPRLIAPTSRELVQYKQPVRYDKVVVKITEHRDDSVSAPGCILVPFQNIKIEKRKDVCLVTSITPEDYERYAGTSSQKKNETNNNRGTQSSQSSQSSERSNGRSPGSSLSPQFSGGSGSVGRGSGDNGLLLVDPKADDLIDLKPGQTLTVRLPVQHWDMKNDVDYFWFINLIQLRQNQFFIKSQQLVRDGRRLWQEIVVSLVPRNGPREIGKFVLGGLRCSNRFETRMIGVRVVIDSLAFSDQNPDYSKTMRELMHSVGKVRKEREAQELQEALEASVAASVQRATEAVKEPRTVMSAGLVRIVRNPENGHAVELGPADCLKITFPTQFVSVHRQGVSTVIPMTWAMTGMPRWLNVKQTVDGEDAKTFMFEMEPGTRFPVPDAVVFRCGTEERRVMVRHSHSDELAGMGS